MNFTALVHGPGLPTTGARLPVQLDSYQLQLGLPEGRRLSLPLGELQLSVGGFNDSVWRFEWQDGQGRWSLALEDAALQQQLAAQPPAALATAIAGLRGHQRRHRAVWRLSVGAMLLWFLLPALLLGLLLWNASALTSRLAGLVPVAQEQKLGEAIWKAQQRQLRLIENTEANRAVQTIGERLTAGSRYHYRWFLARDNSINAFAIPGGVVVVHSGLIAAAGSAEELAGVLAHEVQHVEQRHSLRAMAQSLGISAGLGMIFGDLSGIAQMVTGLSQLSYSREAEREADLEGLKALRAARINPAGMPSMFETLQREAGDLQPPALLSSHPATQERIASLRAAIAASGDWPSEPLELDWPAVQASLR
ncbi:hypothetical protein ED208_10555 [Stagnimonas aquatica]|uniref:Peptidase M48 domain-containing protein n=1 Tax=Stagnimonas aquatica TaxID=2689987 RepID=A0A3N0VAC7_9GAMM|nr:M48 family metallopeptidase [Stagnimonas aquatica]ROH89561.1 hypothetical protein ED208_10555 [Stagnimonas aquatica]